eukprot:TRINITY_DN3914_c0_g1_i1.p1 TRINITY_DN3914_c0_g1~~TRINITY_DN3914_c0_g1_i1.p1  ORF type:complete len:450 (-),score=44.75 TRINITY_DN3914_c0_g1_i1:690-2039(-)
MAAAAAEVECSPEAAISPGAWARDIYHHSRVLSITQVPPVFVSKGPNTKHVVTVQGAMSRCLTISSAALDEIARLATHRRTFDNWIADENHSRLQNYLYYLWVRLLEQANVLQMQALNEAAKGALTKLGISEWSIVFNTNLYDSVGRAILCMGVQQNFRTEKEPFSSGVCVANDPDSPVTKLFDICHRPDLSFQIWGCQLDNVAGPSGPPPPYIPSHFVPHHPEFFYPRDQRLLLDNTAEVDPSASHITGERLDRLISAGLVDPDEGVGERYLRDDETAYEHEEVVLVPKGATTRRAVLKKFDEKKDMFSRGLVGKAAVEHLVHKLIVESVSLARHSFQTAVPQLRFVKVWVKQNTLVYTSHLQLLLPLFSPAGRPAAALVLDLDEDEVRYRANTVLTLSMALGNARLLSTPMAPWIYGTRGHSAAPSIAPCAPNSWSQANPAHDDIGS